jgi:hypothetical protein
MKLAFVLMLLALQPINNHQMRDKFGSRTGAIQSTFKLYPQKYQASARSNLMPPWKMQGQLPVSKSLNTNITHEATLAPIV